jgi:UDP-N-acetylglucosamine 2-epimerase (non-hydrolysing)
LVLVQGDTATALGAALAAYYERIVVGHVEAGLRTFDCNQPFPEETNRVLISRVARQHFCPTLANRENLLTEGVPENHIFVTGNTGIDCFLGFWRKEKARMRGLDDERRTILVTAHRRENADGPFVEICRALVTIAELGLGARIVFPVHPNPVLRRTAERYLKDLSNVEVVAPLRYDRFVSVLARSLLIVTESGGIQEEACTVGKPALVLRNVTERQEGVATGSTRVIGTRKDAIVREVTRLLSDD